MALVYLRAYDVLSADNIPWLRSRPCSQGSSWALLTLPMNAPHTAQGHAHSCKPYHTLPEEQDQDSLSWEEGGRAQNLFLIFLSAHLQAL